MTTINNDILDEIRALRGIFHMPHVVIDESTGEVLIGCSIRRRWNMTTWQDVIDIEKQNGHLVGELKDAKSILKEYRQQHDIDAKDNGLKRCNCTECQQAEAWLARNK